MATPRETPFSAYDFSDEEIKHAMVFNETQRQYLQTLLSDVAVEKLAEAYDPLNPVKFAQRESYSRGWMDCLNHLLAERVIEQKENNPYVDKEAGDRPVQPLVTDINNEPVYKPNEIFGDTNPEEPQS